MVIWDTETTGLLKPDLVQLHEQPQIIEFAAIKLDDITLEEVERFQVLVNPGCRLPEEIIKITGITDALLKDEQPFASSYHDLCNFFLGEQTMVAHNLSFDHGMLRNELKRIGKDYAFPWPPRQVCTVEASYYLNNKRMRLCDLYQHVTGSPMKEAHRAMVDVEALVECVRWLRDQGAL